MSQHSHLEIKDVAALFADDLVSRAGVDLDGDLVTHGAAGNKDGGLAPEKLRSALLKAIDGWIFAVNIVADLGLSHGTAHLCRGLGHCIAAQIDRRPNVWLRVPRRFVLELRGHIFYASL